jgi:hypothetical protein
MTLDSLSDDDVTASPSPQSGGVQSTPAPPPPLAPLHDPADEPGFMQRTWHTIQGIPEELLNLGKGTIHAATDDTAGGNAGFVRGLRDFTDKLMEAPQEGFTGRPEEFAQLDAARNQNAADRAAFDAKYGDNQAAQAGRMWGNTAVTLPITAPFTAGLGTALTAGRSLLPAFLTRGVPGAIVNAGERAVTGGVGGGTQAAATADPSKPLLPQIEAGATTGAVVPAGVGLLTDPASNVVSRLRGNTIRTNPRIGGLPDDQIERATQAQELMNQDVPIMASQVSGDPVLQASSRYGGAVAGSGMQDFMQNQLQKYRQTVLKQAGDTTGSSLMDDATKAASDARINNLYNNSVGSVGAVPAGRGLGLDLDAVRSQVSPGVKPEQMAQVNSLLKHVEDTFNNGGGSISGIDYQALVRSLGPLFGSDEPQLRGAGWRIKQLLDSRAQSVMTKPQIDDFAAANSQFRANKTLQAVAASDGKFTPGDLFKETQDVSKNYGNSPGALDRIAQTGNTVIQPTLTGELGTVGRVGSTALGGFGTMGAAMAAIQKLLTVDAMTTGGTGATIALGAGGANRGVQAMNYGGGPRAVATVARGGGPPAPSELQRALQLLRLPTMATVAANRNAQDQP